jgi:hypothetical protein
MDLSYATIPTCENTYVTLYREPMMKYHVEDPKDPMNELVCVEDDFGNYSIMAQSIVPPLEDTFERK